MENYVEKVVEKSVENCYNTGNGLNFYGGIKGWQLSTNKTTRANT